MRTLASLALAAGLLATGCHSGISYDGDLGKPIKAELHDDVVFIEVEVGDAEPQLLGVDTGAPETVLDPHVFADQGVKSGVGTIGLGFGGLTFDDVPYWGLEFCAPGQCGSQDVVGLVGGGLLKDFEASFDYRAPSLTLGTPELPAGLQTADSIDFSLEGGGASQVGSDKTDVPPTRIVLTATVEGKELTLVLDAGASLVVLDSTVFASLTADGRPTADAEAATESGIQDSKVARSRSIKLGKSEVTGAPIFSAPAGLLDDLAGEVGHSVDGLLGGTFLREFLVSVDYPNSVVELRRYDSRDHIHDQYIRVALAIGPVDDSADTSYGVTQIFPDSDVSADPDSACFGLVTSVDGTKLAGLGVEAADTLLRGAAGESRTLEIESMCSAATFTKTFVVKDVLALP